MLEQRKQESERKEAVRRRKQLLEQRRQESARKEADARDYLARITQAGGAHIPYFFFKPYKPSDSKEIEPAKAKEVTNKIDRLKDALKEKMKDVRDIKVGTFVGKTLSVIWGGNIHVADAKGNMKKVKNYAGDPGTAIWIEVDCAHWSPKGGCD